jgi:FixJ family two-component response regulator
LTYRIHQKNELYFSHTTGYNSIQFNSILVYNNINNNKEKTCILIDVAMPADRNVTKKEAEKKLKYKS